MTTVLIAAGLAAGILAGLIGLVVFRVRCRPLPLERFRPQLEEMLSEEIAPLRATVESLWVTRLRRSGIEVTAQKIRLQSDDGHAWVSFAKVTIPASFSAVVSPRKLKNFDRPWLFSGATVDALSPQAPFEDLHGIAATTDGGLRFDIAGGRWKEADVSTATVIIEGLGEDQSKADISFQLKATAGCAIEAVTTTPLDFVDPSLLPETGIEGTADADISLSFAFDELPLMSHHTRAQLQGLRLPNAIGNLDLSKGLFDITVEDGMATIEGTARLGGVPMTLRYSKTSPSRPETLTIKTADVGVLASKLSVSGRFSGGQLSVNLARDCSSEPWSGSIDIRDLRLLKAPLLSRLLTMASLNGLLSTLVSDGLRIDHGQAEVKIETERLRCTSVKISVDQLEITGHIDFHLDADRIEGEGLLIPAASLQRLVGAVPIVGAFLEGLGKKNVPIVATRFTLFGPLSSPEITIHPLSSIAPDILRDLGLI